MNQKIEIKKILAMILMSIMVCASVVIVMPNNTVVAEDSAKPLAGLDNGFPAMDYVVDQSQVLIDNMFQFGANSYLTQTFTQGFNGELPKISIYTSFPSGVGTMQVEITTAVDIGGGVWWPDQPIPGAVETIDGSDVPNGDWLDIEFSSPPTLVNGVMYTIFISTDSFDFYWAYANDYYAGGVGWNGDPTPVEIGGDFAFKTYQGVPTEGLKKVAWHESGDYALGVTGTEDGEVYRYQRSNGTWYLAFTTNPSGTNYDIIYSEYWENFFIVGGIGGFTNSYTWNQTSGLVDLGSTGTDGAYQGVVACPDPYYFLAVGHDLAGFAKFSWYNSTSSSYEEYFTPSDEWLYDVTYSPSDNKYYAVGELSGEGIVYMFNGSGATTGFRVSDSWDITLSPINGVDWGSVSAGNNYGLAVSSNIQTTGNIFKLELGAPEPDSIFSSTDILRDIDWHPDGTMAMIIGYNAGNDGVIYHYIPDNHDAITKMSVDGDYGKLYGVDVKAWTSPSSGLIVGAAGGVGSFLSAADSGTTLTINVDEPHSFDIDMWKTSDGVGGPSKLNLQVDVETTYTFFSEVNYTIGGVDQFYGDPEDDVRIELQAWYDEGATPGLFPTPDDEHRTRAFAAVWSEGAAPGGDAVTMQYPTLSPGTDEFLLDSFWLDPSAPGDSYYIYINVTLGPQTWAASGPFGGASTFIWDNTQSHNDANSWDFEMRIYDINFGAAENSTFEEFGVFQFTNISVSGNPSGNAPPGSIGVQLGPDSTMTCSANRDYYVNVSIPDLARVGGGADLLATNIAVNTTSAFATDVNSEIFGAAVFFPGANQNLSVWGNTSQPFADWDVSAPLNSTTAHGPQGGDFQSIGATVMEWWVNVPGGTAEGVYQATITFRIGYY